MCQKFRLPWNALVPSISSQCYTATLNPGSIVPSNLPSRLVDVAAIREARENLKLIGELTGKLRGGATVNVGVFSRSPQDAEAARERILTELERLATRSASPPVAQ